MSHYSMSKHKSTTTDERIEDGKLHAKHRRLYLLEFTIEEVKLFAEFHTAGSQRELVINFDFLKEQVETVKPTKLNPGEELQCNDCRVKMQGVRSCLFSLSEPSDESVLTITVELYETERSRSLGVSRISLGEMFRVVRQLLNRRKRNTYSMFSCENYQLTSVPNNISVGYLRGCVRLSCFEKETY